LDIRRLDEGHSCNFASAVKEKYKEKNEEGFHSIEKSAIIDWFWKFFSEKLKNIIALEMFEISEVRLVE